jgi:copper chaperone NosL
MITLRTSFITLVVALGALAFTACRPQPSDIAYGTDACSFCSMTVVQKQYGAELVTDKGKVFKYDAIECLVRELKKRDPATIGLLLVNTYDSPGALQDATARTYLISEALPSPMGANLTAFDSEATAQRVQQGKGGTLYDWHALQAQF